MRNRSTNADTLMRIRLPLPHKALHPNTRTHWAAKARQVKIAREAARRETFKLLRDVEVKPLIVGYILRPHYRDRRRRDQDSLVASVKAHLDGIADAFRQDDSSFRCLGVFPELNREDPHLIVELEIEDLS